MSKASLVDPRWRRLARVRLYCNGSCIATVILGGLVLAGWVFHVESLKSAFLHSETVTLGTSFGLIFLGISLWLLLPDPPRPPRRRWGLLSGALVASLGAITLVEYGLSRDLHIHSVDPAGRMAPITAMTFLALGMALLLVDGATSSQRRLAQVLSLWGWFAGIMSVSGLINGATAAFRIFSYARVDVYTALVLFAMSTAIFFARPRVGIAGDLTGRFMGSAMARRFLPAVIIVPIVASWIRMQGQRSGLFGTGLGLGLNVTVNVVSLSVLVWLNARQLNKAEQSLEEARKDKDAFYNASLRDELTGLYNRRGFLTFAEEQIKLACSGRRELLVVFADVDGLKAINDRFGHSEGDRVLQKTAEVLLSVFRDTDWIARLGGDEFAVLALDCSRGGWTRINAHLEKVLRIVNDGDRLWKLSISVGAVPVDSKHQLSIEDLLDKADGIMYDRKRGNLVFASE